jgi:hypothetical protein
VEREETGPGREEVARLMREIAATRRVLRRAVGVRAVSRGLLVGGILLLAAALASRISFLSAASLPTAVAAAGAGLLVAVAGARRAPGSRETALWLDRTFEAEEHFIAALELAEGPADSDRAGGVARGALRILDEADGEHRRGRSRLEWFVPALLAGIAAAAVLMLPRGDLGKGEPRASRGDLAARESVAGGEASRPDGTARGPEVSGGPAGRGAAGAPDGRAPEATPSGDRSAGAVSGREPSDGGGQGGGAPEGGISLRSPEGIREALRRARDGLLSERDREGILRSLERPGGDEGGGEPGGGGTGAASSSRSTSPDRSADGGLRPGGSESPGPGPLAGRFPARYRDLVARYFDPSL